MKAVDGTPIVERWVFWYRTALTNPKCLHYVKIVNLIEELSAAEERERVINQRLNSMAHEPFNTPEELMQDLIRENSVFSTAIVTLKERERVLREALDDAGRWLSIWEPDPKPAAHRVKAALATPAPEQPAQPKEK